MSNKFKIIFIGKIRNLDNLIAFSGGGIRTLNVLKYLNEKGISPTYIHLNDSPTFINNNHILKNFWLIYTFEKMKEKNCIILEEYVYRLETFIFNCWIAMRRKAKLIIILNCLGFVCYKSVLKKIIDKILSIIFLAPGDLVITSGKALTEKIIALGVRPEKIIPIYPALRDEFIKTRPVKNQIESCNDTTNLLYVGRMAPIKGLEYLIEAIHLLNNKKIKLLMVVDPTPYLPYEKEILSSITKFGLSEKIEIKKNIHEPQRLVEIYKASDIFILPSLWDTSPITVIEAMSCGLPVIASEVGGIPEFVKDGISGILFPPKSSKAIADSISKLVKDPRLRQQMANNALKQSSCSLERSWEDVGNEYFQVIQKLSKGNQ